MTIKIFWIFLIFFIINSYSVHADHNDPNNVSETDFFLNYSVNDEYKNNDEISIDAGDEIIFRILNYKNEEIKEGRIEIMADSSNSSNYPLKKHNKKYYANIPFEEKYINYSLNVRGITQKGGIPTQNNVTINVRTNYQTITLSEIENFKDTEFTRNLGSLKLTYHNKNTADANEFKNNLAKFSDSVNSIYDSIQRINETNEPTGLNVEDVEKDYTAVINSMDSMENKTQIIAITNELNSIKIKIAKEINAKSQIILNEKLTTAQDNHDNQSKNFKELKNSLINTIIYPAGFLVILGIVAGFINVHRWKKKYEYYKIFGKVKLLNPVKISIIISIIFILLILIILIITDNLTILKYLI